MQLEEATITELQEAMNAGSLTARQLTELYLERIAQLDPTLHAIIEINPEALQIADELDRERQERGPRGPLHGIPVLVKENMATRDQMQTTAGSLALFGSRVPRDAFTVARLREAGAVLLGKANLSEWANFRAEHSSSGWSARGGQALNPYVLDRSPCGSSSGSATSIAANLAVVSLGTETDGSIICPASINGVVGIKPTVGLTSRAGVIPIAHSQDTVGPFARTVRDAAILLSAIIGPDQHDPATTDNPYSGPYSNPNLATQPLGGDINGYFDYTKHLDQDGLRGARIGVAREAYFGYNSKADEVVEQAIARLRELGVEIIDPANIETAREMQTSEGELTVLLYELKADLNSYLAELESSPVRSLAEIIAFNQAHKDQEMPYFGQERFLQAEEKGTLDDEEYKTALGENHRLSRDAGIDAVMERYQLDALVMPSTGLAWCIDQVLGDHHQGGSSQSAALAGYPIVTVPAGFVSELPVGISFLGRAFSEPTLIKLAYAFEQATQARRTPKMLPTLPLNTSK
jgi:amidase